MFEGKTIEELVEIVQLAEHRSQPPPGKPYVVEAKNSSPTEAGKIEDMYSFLLGAA